MPVRFLPDADLALRSAWPTKIAAEDLVTFFTFTDDLAWLAAMYTAAGTSLVPPCSWARCRGWGWCPMNRPRPSARRGRPAGGRPRSRCGFCW
jgi:hypothetical protein